MGLAPSAGRIRLLDHARQVIQREHDAALTRQFQRHRPVRAAVLERILAPIEIAKADHATTRVVAPVRCMPKHIGDVAGARRGVVRELFACPGIGAALDHARTVSIGFPHVAGHAAECADLFDHTPAPVAVAPGRGTGAVLDPGEPSVVIVAIVRQHARRPAANALYGGQASAVAGIMHLQYVTARAAKPVQPSRGVPDATDALAGIVLDVLEPCDALRVELFENAIARREIGHDHRAIGQARQVQAFGQHRDARA
ncbi:hypothetical protein D3C81_1456450 [compost metagenome]